MFWVEMFEDEMIGDKMFVDEMLVDRSVSVLTQCNLKSFHVVSVYEN